MRNLELERRLAPSLSMAHLIWATVTAVGFLGIIVVLDFVMDDFDPLKDTISAHANGPGSLWITLGFVVAGLAVVPAGYPLTWIMATRAMKWTIGLLFGLGGLCILLLAVFPTDPPGASTSTGAVHLALAAAGIVVIMIGAIVGSWNFVKHDWWPYNGFFSTCMAGIILGTFGVVATVALVGALDDGHPVEGALGLTERAVVAAELLWVTHMVWRVRSVAVKEDRLRTGDRNLYLDLGQSGADAAARPVADAPRADSRRPAA